MASFSGSRSVSPGQLSEMIGVPQAAASNSRTEGEWPKVRLAARVTFSVNRWLL